jgi:SAM-dependent methyltransferase
VRYAGKELDLFDGARNWKAYWSSLVRPYLTGRVLEVGAGIGSNTKLLLTPGVERWTVLEPDPAQLAEARRRLGDGDPIDYAEGTVSRLSPGACYDAILYADVLEHIADDREELLTAASRLRPHGRLIVLAPAHQALFSPFDAAIGHHRRYSREALRALTPSGTRWKWGRYLDSCGLLLSLLNRTVLRASMPTAAQIRFWDRLIVPLSRRLDPLLAYRSGKSVLAVWCRVSC